jgi:hypothetical protein
MKKTAFLTMALTVAVFALALVGGRAVEPTSSAAADVGPYGQSIASTSDSVETPDYSGLHTTLAARTPPTGNSFFMVKPATMKALSSYSERDPKVPAPKVVPESPVVAPAAPDSGVVDAGAQADTQSETEYAPEPQGCPGDAGGGVGGAPGYSSAQGVAGTTSDDLASFAYQYNAIRVANCLEPIPYGNFYYDSCMEDRLFWMAESPSADPLDAWGHMGSVRIDGVPSPGCDGNLAGGSDNSGATVAQKWWDSIDHRASLYRPDSGVDGACIAFAMSHGGIDEPYSFTRSAARWTSC